jgi:hypothetical protein
LRDFPLPLGRVLARHIIFRYLPGANFLSVACSGVFDARYDPGLKRVAFLYQLVDTFRIDTFYFG